MNNGVQLRLFDDKTERITYYKTSGYIIERSRLNHAITKYTEVYPCKVDIMNSAGWTATVRTRLRAIWPKRKSRKF